MTFNFFSKKTYSLWLLCSIIATALTGLIVGYDLCVVSVLIDSMRLDLHLCPLSPKVFTSSKTASDEKFVCMKESLIVSILYPGAAIGSLTAGFFAEKYGRRYTIMLSDVFFLFGSLIFMFGQSFLDILIARFLLGAGVGVGFVVFSTYIPEIAPAKHRGKLVAIQDAALSLGCFFSFCIISIVSVQFWHQLIGFLSVIAFSQLIGAIFLPESPRWLVKKGRTKEALQSLILLTPKPFHNTSSLSCAQEEEHHTQKCIAELELIENDVKHSQNLKHRGTISHLQFEDVPSHTLQKDTNNTRVSSTMSCSSSEKRNACFSWIQKQCQGFTNYLRFLRLYRKQLFIAIGCACAQNFMFGNNLIYYTVPILKKKSFVSDIRLFSFGVGLSKFCGILSAIFLVDKIGRRPILLWGSIVTCIGHVVFSILFYLLDKIGSQKILITSLIINFYIFIFSWNISWAGLMFVVASEVLPSAVRGIGISLTITTFWLLSFFFQLTFGILVHVLTFAGAFCLFALMNCFTILFVVYCIEDHTCQKLENIHDKSSEPNTVV
ncbi:uncharacterized protein LOC128884104 isoform X2 [Hylaeus volcanicus]|uniref:uncharacterized protein LOC128884104 isoform X2 n=1 Tax=Hylaeus volcanicus TaxID=313075 RepID=UPI0023B7E503|nr:uncharacterized protein LOC128884104 isoform X2 [Hylaeus volcanicus]